MEDVALEQVRMPSNRCCHGSSHGWLITVDEPLFNGDDDDDLNFDIRLFNPFLSTNGFEILLPSLTTVNTSPIPSGYISIYGFLCKAVLSANPTDYTVMAIHDYGSGLAFFKPGNKRWTCMEFPDFNGGKREYFTDVIYMYGKFFVVTWDGTIVAVSDDVGEQGSKGMIAKLVLLQPPIPDKMSPNNEYLIVESSGRELLKVHRFISVNQTSGFRVFKLKVTTGGAKEEEEYYEWQEVKSLCGDSVFLGHNTSISIRASDYPGCKPNSIYYTDDSSDFWMCQDIGIFNLEDGSFKRRHLPTLSKKIYDTVWIQPTLPNKNRRSSSSC